jgi:hypothetical protein
MLLELLALNTRAYTDRDMASTLITTVAQEKVSSQQGMLQFDAWRNRISLLVSIPYIGEYISYTTEELFLFHHNYFKDG